MENASTLFLCSLMHSCATRYPKTRRARSRCRNREHATMIVEREARADFFWVLQASAGVVHGLHGVLLLPCGPRAWARAAARSLFFVGKPHMSDLGVVKPVLCRSGVCGVKAMRGPGGLPTTALTTLAFT